MGPSGPPAELDRGASPPRTSHHKTQRSDEPVWEEISEDELADLPPVQRLAYRELSPTRPPSEIAADGMSDVGARLPHGDQIQASFGRHDISGVQAHQGSAAAEAGQALGATAFTMGDSIGFAKPPDLHTAAHEAAHVVQQRNGVQLAGGIDQPGDAYERQADEVADAVVEGRSAEPILDRIEPGTTNAPVVQRHDERTAGTTAKTATKHVDESASVEARPSDVAAIIGRAEHCGELIGLVRSTLLPAYRNAVDQIAPIAALEFARNCVRSYTAVQSVLDLLADTHAMPIDPGSAAAGRVASLEHELPQRLAEIDDDLAIQLGPQMFKNEPVLLGSYVHVNARDLGKGFPIYLATESATTVELLSLVHQIRQIAGSNPGSVPELSSAQRSTIIAMVERWKSRPVNFAFLRRVLTDEGIWQAVASERSVLSGQTLEQTNTRVRQQAQQTGALADVGSLDIETLQGLMNALPGSTPTLIEMIADAAPSARGPILRQVRAAGWLDQLLTAMPRKQVQQLAAAIKPFDAEMAGVLGPYWTRDKEGGKSIHKMYMEQVDEHARELTRSDSTLERAYHVSAAWYWFSQDAIYNGLTGGFANEYGDAYDAYQQGEISEDDFRTKATKAAGKAAVIMVASAAAGGVTGKLAQGVAGGLGAGESLAGFIGGTVGGFGAGVGGHFAGDVFDQKFNGKEGFDSASDYMKSGITGAVMGGISVGAGKFLPRSSQRMIDVYAERYPGLARVLEDIRIAGEAPTAKIRMSVKEFLELKDTGIGGPGSPNAFALPGGSRVNQLGIADEVEVTVRPSRRLNEPLQTSTPNKPDGPPEQAVDIVKVEHSNETTPITTPSPEASDPWNSIVRKHGLDSAVETSLRNTGAEPSSVDRLLSSRVSVEKIIQVSADFGPKGVAALDGLVKGGAQIGPAAESLAIAREVGVVDEVVDLAVSGKLENARGFKAFLQQMRAETLRGQNGKRNELVDAANRARTGNRVSLGGRKRLPNDPESGQADIVDYTARDAIQLKTIETADIRGVIDNGRKAVHQLQGKFKELPPSGFRGIVELKITNRNNPLYGVGRVDAARQLHGQLDLQVTDVDILIRVDNANPAGPLEFRSHELAGS